VLPKGLIVFQQEWQIWLYLKIRVTMKVNIRKLVQLCYLLNLKVHKTHLDPGKVITIKNDTRYH